MRAELPFYFGDGDEPVRQTFALHIPKGLQTKGDLLSSYAQAGDFPDYFGKNWDALEELLSDFSWITQPRILIIDEDLPLGRDKKELKNHLEVLRSAVAKNATRLRVCFPSGVREDLIRMLNES